MEILENILKDLIYSNTLYGLKIEFEAQGASLDEVIFLNNLAKKYDVNFSVKISGAEAIRDLNDIKNLNLHTIIAPLIESPYALEKFVNSVDKIYQNNSPKLEINVESIMGFKNLDEIINSEKFKRLYGVKIGRTDLANSMGLNREFVNSDDVFAIVEKISSKIASEGLNLTLGGGVDIKTLEFTKKMPYLTQIETRNVILNLNNFDNLPRAIELSHKFEIALIENKEKFGIKLDKNDLERIKILSTR